MLLVIFGAGASYDSVPDLPPPPDIHGARRPQIYENHPENFRPPLANQLFDNRPLFTEAMTRFRECMPLATRLRQAGVQVEKELAKIQLEGKSFPRVERELTAIRYYIHFSLWECERLWQVHHKGITNYLTLVREIERWRHETSELVCFVNFNYDTMLENAIQEFQSSEIANLQGYLSMGSYALIKPHGSVNWGFEVFLSPEGFTPQRIIREVTAPAISKNIRLVKQHPMVAQDGILVYPAIAIPIETKDEFICPENHLRALAQVIPKVTKVITIGWRATEASFLGMLRNRLGGLPASAALMVVSGSRDGALETCKNMGRVWSVQPVETGFTGLFENTDLLHTFLRSRPAGGPSS